VDGAGTALAGAAKLPLNSCDSRTCFPHRRGSFGIVQRGACSISACKVAATHSARPIHSTASSRAPQPGSVLMSRLPCTLSPRMSDPSPPLANSALNFDVTLAYARTMQVNAWSLVRRGKVIEKKYRTFWLRFLGRHRGCIGAVPDLSRRRLDLDTAHARRHACAVVRPLVAGMARLFDPLARPLWSNCGQALAAYQGSRCLR
jgi:hypothetical protein